MHPKFIPILYSTEMVQALDENRKLQTRRTKGLEFFNQEPNKYRYDGNSNASAEKPCDRLYHWFEEVNKKGKPLEIYKPVKCPYGQVGDILWVRECFAYSDDIDQFYWYKQDFQENYNEEYLKRIKGIWKPSIHMPKEACRFFLKITDIRVERLLSISDNDAIQEGIGEVFFPKILNMKAFRLYNKEYSVITTKPRTSFFSLWASINGKKSLEKNPWVWVITFERIEKPENFI